MSKIILADGSIVADYTKPYIIAEVNSSHNGDIETAKKMIDAAVEAKCDCVKFQSWTTASLYSQSYYKNNPIAKRFVDKLSLDSSQLKEMAEYCREKGIGFSSTPYSKEEVDFLVEECQVPFIKISSMEVNNSEFLEYIAQKRIPIIISTGMSDIEEIENAVDILVNAGNSNLILLHCVSIYPTPLENANLNNIIGLRERFGNFPIGYSDHTLGDTAAVVATTFGAAVIEKHITLDSKKIGMDNQMAMEPEMLKQLVQKCEETVKCLGTKGRVVTEEEYKQRNNMRRSIVTTKKLEAGHVLVREDMDVKRPGSGLPPNKIHELIGMRINKDIDSDMLIMMSDIDK